MPIEHELKGLTEWRRLLKVSVSAQAALTLSDAGNSHLN